VKTKEINRPIMTQKGETKTETFGEVACLGSEAMKRPESLKGRGGGDILPMKPFKGGPAQNIAWDVFGSRPGKYGLFLVTQKKIVCGQKLAKKGKGISERCDGRTVPRKYKTKWGTSLFTCGRKTNEKNLRRAM